ncbi:MAG TPA: 16S rRNA (guanine(527)-N(7))-methyltransferase RsmG [Methylomirabilota bacterium]|nr:16S rRNA (guanine(527)-N(7))-methyltransferase RsmG [Methylomirabilota bacterium]
MHDTKPDSSKPVLDGNRVCRAMAEFGIALTSEQVAQILSYLRLLLAWNEKINLTAIRDPVEILYRHFCESMFAAARVPIEAGRLADVGSGAGFPGLPLKILQPKLHVFLIESNVKKAAFLAEVVRELNLSEARVLVARYEELGEEVGPLDFVCSRAVGEMDRLLTWATGVSLSAQHVVLWAGSRDVAGIQSHSAWRWREPILVPHSLRRVVLVGDRA